MTVGFDTGFFVRLLGADPSADAIWSQVEDRYVSAAVSCITLFEFERLGLRGALDHAGVQRLLGRLPHAVRLVWLADASLLSRAARIGYGHGLAMADALILASLVSAGAERIYTTDRDLLAYDTGPEVILLA